jgi:hypothetical protein
MEKTTKILIIICLVLVVGFSLTLGLLLGTHLNTPLVVNTTNNTTNTTVNNSTTPQTKSNSSANQQTSTSGYISADQAISIAKSSAAYYPGPDTSFTASFVDGSRPYWQVTAWENDPNSTVYGEAIGGAEIDAKTGQFLGGMG